ncbi:T-complex protein 11 homolog isoform X1 [Anas platyrhynchos]|uniref:T-complex protein 11 homolog isoform X1 n=2 Tax=Anas platyrhynchos TaxID=8839 RepID=UPI000F7C2D61|eukprot:XP_027300838.1 T-complex protein 11 homolog isoform X1 [Anas platyrhynchos]
MPKPSPGDERPPRPAGAEAAAGRPRDCGEERPRVPASPPQDLSVSELQEVSDEMYKLTLAHEIVLNGDFKLQMGNFSPFSLENRVKETLHKAFWDNLKEQISASPPNYTQAIQLLQEIKEALLSLLLPRHNRLQSRIEEALDMELIRQEAEHGVLDICGLTTYILDTMAMLCAPVRDEEVQGLQSLTDPAQLFREIFRVLDLMKMDMLNFSIQSLRPHLRDHSIQYERKKFQELLDKLPNSLDHTTEWLREAAAEVSASLSESQPHSAALQGAVGGSPALPSLTAVLNQGYMNLLCWEPGQKEYPETLLMDQARLQEVRAQVNQLATTAAVLLVTSSTCGSALFGSPGFVARLKLVTKVLLEGLSCTRCEEALQDISDQVLQEVSRALSQLGYPALTSDRCASLKGQIKSIADKSNTVWHVIEQRIHLFLSRFISPDGWNSQKDFPKGLDAIQEELQEVGRRFRSVIHHNRQVFGPFYLGILKKVLFPEAEPESDAGTDSF